MVAPILVLVAACGGTAAAPTPSPAATVGVAAAPAASPQRPPLASPAASPSVAAAVAATTPTAAAAAVEPAGETTTYEVQSGDTLLSIAQQQYGDGTQWRRIYDANKDAIGADPDKLKLGTQLKIPPKQS